MQYQEFKIRPFRLTDQVAIKSLYTQVAQQGNGIIRYPFEITEAYVQGFMTKSIQTGLGLVMCTSDDQIVGEIHAYMPDIFASRHMLVGLTVLVHPDYRGRDIGKQLFVYFLELVQKGRKDILRIELYVRSQNTKVIKLYESLGFQTEGRLHNRILTQENSFQTPIQMAWMNPSFRKDTIALSTKNQVHFNLTPVIAEDLPKLSKLARQVYSQHFLYLWKDDGNWYRQWAFSKEKLAKELEEDGAQWYITHTHGQAIGFLKTIDAKNCNGPNDSYFKIERIYLLKEAMGSGIGKGMLNYALEKAKAAKRSYIYLEVMDSNDESILFYEKNGFEKCGQHSLEYEQIHPHLRGMFKMQRPI